MYVEERYNPYQLDLGTHFSLISIKGNDAEDFLSSGLTSNVKKLPEHGFQVSARLNRLGKVMAYGHLLKENIHHYYFLIEKALAERFILDLEKFIVMEDVKVEQTNKNYTIEWAPYDADDYPRTNAFRGYFWGEYTRILLDHSSPYPLLDKELCHKIRRLNGHVFQEEIPLSTFVNETYLNEVAVDYQKGCFLGQETASKIHNNRGGAYFPVLIETNMEIEQTQGTITLESKKFGLLRNKIKLNGRFYLIVSVKREFRVHQKKYSLSIENTVFEGTLINFPLFQDKDLREKAKQLYIQGVGHFKENREMQAISFLEKSIRLSPGLQDAYEVLGVIYGRRGEYEKAILFMDKLLEIDDTSIMAHTNKSLYFMKMGQIESAEKEKSLATVKSFQKLGRQAEGKKKQEDKEKREKKEIERKKKMFEEVLHLDHRDTIANFGLGEIALKQEDYPKAKSYLENVIENDEKYSKAYLLLGTALTSMGQKKQAASVFRKGIEVASQKGEMMPANEMQAKLLKLSC